MVALSGNSDLHPWLDARVNQQCCTRRMVHRRGNDLLFVSPAAIRPADELAQIIAVSRNQPDHASRCKLRWQPQVGLIITQLTSCILLETSPIFGFSINYRYSPLELLPTACSRQFAISGR